MVNNQIVEAGKMVTIPNPPVRNGYVFDGWYIDNNIFANPYNFFNPVSDNITLYAKWLDSAYYNANLGNTGSNNNNNNNNNTSNPTPSTVAITFDSNGGTPVKTQIINNGQFAQRPESPKKSGYIFSGWFVNTNYDEVYLFESTPVTKDITLYARWIYDGSSQGGNSGPNSGSNGGTTDKPNNDDNQNNKPDIGQTEPKKNADDVAALTKIIEDQIAKGATISEDIDHGDQYSWSLNDNEYRLVGINWNSNRYLQEKISFVGLLKLEILALDGNYLKDIDISQNNELEYLGCGNNLITELKLNKNNKLRTLDCRNNKLSNLDINNCNSLIKLDCSNNALENLSINSRLLESLTCYYNQLKQIDISNCSKLEYLYCYHNQLQELDLENNIYLKFLYCENNKIEALNLMNNTKLQSLDCGNNQLNELKLQKNIFLTGLKCYGNNISSLDLNKNIYLEYLECYGNNISVLDLTNNTKLKAIECDRDVQVIGHSHNPDAI